MIKLKIDMLKLTGAKSFTAKDGTEFIAVPIAANNLYVGKKSISLDLTLMSNRDGRDQYDNDGFCSVDVGKERRLAGERGPILGNWRDMDGGGQGGRDVSAAEATRKTAGQHQQAKQDGYATQPDDDSEDCIPF